MINIPGNRPVRRPVENNRVKQKERVEASDKTATEKPTKGAVLVERRRNPDRRQDQSSTSVELRSRRDRRRARRIDVDV